MGRILDIFQALITPGDTDSNTSAGAPVVARLQGYNGSTWTRLLTTTTGLLKLAVQVANGATAPSDSLAVGGTASDGKLYRLTSNGLGHLMTLPAKGTGGQSSAFEASHVISASACWPARVTCINTNAAQRFLMVFNATSLPANGAMPVGILGAGATIGSATKTWNLPVDRFTVGLVVALSSTSTSLTVTTTSDTMYEWELFPSPN